MNAIVVLNEVSVTRVNVDGHMGKTVYDGTVTLQARSSGLDFNYVFPFNSFDSVAGAVAQAAAMLKSELHALSAATQRVLNPQAEVILAPGVLPDNYAIILQEHREESTMPKTDYSDSEISFPRLQAKIYTIDGKMFFATVWLWEKAGGPRQRVSDGAAGSIKEAHAVIQKCAEKYGADVGSDDIDVHN